VGAHSSSSKNPQLPQQQQPQRARENEINTAKRDKIGFARVDLLYSESLTKSTKNTKSTGEFAHLSIIYILWRSTQT
jgi:hypothetical protein